MIGRQAFLAALAVAGMILFGAGAANVAAAAEAGGDIFVAPGGSDANPGTAEKPLATFAAAQKAVRALRAAKLNLDKPVVVVFKGGFYELPDTIVFEPADSGTAASPTIYRAAAGEKPVFSGGRRITGWKTDDKGRWTVTLPAAKCPEKDLTCDELWDAFVAKKALKLPTEGKWEFSQLFVDGQRRYRPRHPESGYLKLSPGPNDAFGAKFPGEGTNGVNSGEVKPGWHNLDDVEFVIMNGWNTGRYRISASNGGTFWITGPGAGGAWWNGIIEGRRYWLSNILELIKPGQFYLDRKAGQLIYWPLPGQSPEKTEVIAPFVTRLVDFRGDLGAGKWVQHVRLEGLSFAHSNWNLVRGIAKGGRGLPQAELDVDAAVKAIGLRDSAFKGCTFEHIGQYALRLDVGCKADLVEDCEFIDIGGGGVWVGSTHEGGWGFHDDLPKDAKFADLAACELTVRNCLVANVCRLHAGSVGIWIGQAHHCVIEHNEVFDTYYAGLNNGWRWGCDNPKDPKGTPSSNHDNTIAFNYIHKIGQGVLADMGAIYTLGTSKGTVFRNNVLEDIFSYRNNQGCGFYNDSGSEHLLFENNLIVGANDGAYHNHQARNITLRNNIFAANNGTIKHTDCGSYTFESNVVYVKGGYLIKVAQGGGRLNAKSNLVWPRGAIGKDSINADPMFVDEAKGDWRLKDDSPAIKQCGFKPFDPRQAGRLAGFRTGAQLPKAEKVDY